MAAMIVAVTSAETCGGEREHGQQQHDGDQPLAVERADVAQPEGDVGEQVQGGAADQRRRDARA